MEILYELVTVIREQLSMIILSFNVTDESREGGQARRTMSQETCLLRYRIESKPRVTGCTSFLRFDVFSSVFCAFFVVPCFRQRREALVFGRLGDVLIFGLSAIKTKNKEKTEEKV